MTRVNFSDYAYFPALLSSAEEHMAFENLNADTKDALLPIFEISRHSTATNFDQAIASLRHVAGNRPFILDLYKEPPPQPREPRDREDADSMERYQRQMVLYQSHANALTTLLNSTDGFSAWRELTATFPNAVPTLQFSDAARENRQVIRQAANLARNGNSFAIRITSAVDGSIFEAMAAITSILDTPEQMLLIVDCGQGRIQIPHRAEFAAQAIARVHTLLSLAERAQIRAVCLSNSFMKPSRDGFSTWDNLDWRLWEAATETHAMTFGDYGASNRFQSTYMPSDWRATVVMPLDHSWQIYRHPNANDRDGWIVGARRIRDEGGLDGAPDCWGTRMIGRAAEGNIAGVESARFWRAAKVNIHITRQTTFAGGPALEWDEDE